MRQKVHSHQLLVQGFQEVIAITETPEEGAIFEEAFRAASALHNKYSDLIANEPIVATYVDDTYDDELSSSSGLVEISS